MIWRPATLCPDVSIAKVCGIIIPHITSHSQRNFYESLLVYTLHSCQLDRKVYLTNYDETVPEEHGFPCIQGMFKPPLSCRDSSTRRRQNLLVFSSQDRRLLLVRPTTTDEILLREIALPSLPGPALLTSYPALDVLGYFRPPLPGLVLLWPTPRLRASALQLVFKLKIR